MRATASRTHHFALALVALALLVRAAIPAGWMPASDGGRWITLCTGSGAVAAFVDADGVRHDDPAPAAQDHPCAFAGVAVPLTPPLAIAVPLPSFETARPARLAAATVAIGRGLAAPPPPSTGPPALL
jgi:hypothetical protein